MRTDSQTGTKGLTVIRLSASTSTLRQEQSSEILLIVGCSKDWEIGGLVEKQA